MHGKLIFFSFSHTHTHTLEQAESLVRVGECWHRGAEWDGIRNNHRRNGAVIVWTPRASTLKGAQDEATNDIKLNALSYSHSRGLVFVGPSTLYGGVHGVRKVWNISQVPCHR